MAKDRTLKYAFNYASEDLGFKNPTAEAEAVVGVMLSAVQTSLAPYALHLDEKRFFNSSATEAYEKMSGMLRKTSYSQIGSHEEHYAWPGVRCALTEDNKLVVTFPCNPILPENSNEEVIEDIRNAFLEAGLITADEQPVLYTPPKKGCYVATAVYGSYDCPQVWTLRRYRDSKLAQTPCGRAFIRAYYATSPTVVKYFGQTELFNHFVKKHLDRMVNRLNKKGFANTPYAD